MADRFTQFLMHPATQMAAGIMAGSDPQMQGLGGVGAGIMSAGKLLTERERMQLKARQQAAGNYSKSPIFARGPGGDLQVWQLGAGGAPVQAQFPQGVEPIKPYEFLNLEDRRVPIAYGEPGPRPDAPELKVGVPPVQQPAFKGAQTRATTESRMRTERREDAEARLPRATLTGQRILERLDDLRRHPGLASSTGWSTVWPVLPGSSRQDFLARMEEITGGTFLQGYEMLKGGGPITDVEGRKAEAAINRMNAATNEKDFLAAMDDYAQAVSDGVWLLQEAAGREATGLPIPWRGGGGAARQTSGPGGGRNKRNRPSRAVERRQRRERLEQIRRERGR